MEKARDASFEETMKYPEEMLLVVSHLCHLGRSQCLGLGSVGAQNTNGQARAGEGLAPHEMLGETEFLAQRAYLLE